MRSKLLHRAGWLSQRGVVLCVLLLAVVSLPLRAQNPPARLPAVVVNAAPDPPGPRKVAGVVRDTAGFGVEGVEISIPALQLRGYSSTNGDFRFDDVKPGKYEVRARKLGYAPQIRPLTVEKSGGVIAFSLLPIPQALLPVVSVAARGGLSGVVGDTGFHALSGAIIKALGHSDRTITDSTGAFFLPLGPGSYMVSIQEPGFDYKIVGVIIPPDSGRRITAYLKPLAKPPSHREAHNIDDFNSRAAWKSDQRTRMYTRAELEHRGIEWVTPCRLASALSARLVQCSIATATP